MRTLSTVLIAALLFLTLACGGTEDGKKTDKPSNPPPNPNGSAGTPSNSNEMAPGGNATLGQKAPERRTDEKKDSSTTAATDAKSTERINAAQIFSTQKCTMCHGEDGKGKLKGTPDFTDAAWQRKQKDAELIETVTQGKSPKMPAFGSKLKDEEIKALVAYVRSFAKK